MIVSLNNNAMVLKNKEFTKKRSCNCKVTGNCPLDRKCLHECTAYPANVITNNEYKENFGTPEEKFKLRLNNHTMSFRHKKRVKDTELSKYLWKLREEKVDCNLQWSIKAYAPYKYGTRKCDLCFTENIIIVSQTDRVAF